MKWIDSFNGALQDSWRHGDRSWVMPRYEANCGAYAFLWACAFTLGAKHKRWRGVLKRFYFLSRSTAFTGMEPERLVSEFEATSLLTYKPNHLSLIEKWKWLQRQLCQGRPVVLCIERPFKVKKEGSCRFLDWHLVTACGYDRDAIYVIDPAPLADCDVALPIPLRKIMKDRLLKTSVAANVYVSNPDYVKAKTRRVKIDGKPMCLADKARFRVWASDGWAVSVAAP